MHATNMCNLVGTGNETMQYHKDTYSELNASKLSEELSTSVRFPHHSEFASFLPQRFIF